MVQRSFGKRLLYNTLRVLVRLACVLVFRIRCRGRENEPPRGAAIICANHQSFFDPVFVGLAFNRRLNFLARKSLFASGPFTWLIESLDAIAIDREGFGLAGLKESLRRLRRGEMVLVFPEGTRSRDGEVAPFKPGITAMVRRCEVTLVPVGVDGAYQSWPRSERWPRLEVVHVVIGEPLSPELCASLSDHSLIEELERRVRECCETARRGRLKRRGKRGVRLP
jgi:1-acyl-sn-glycerol-3-phosphate acyltransferase